MDGMPALFKERTAGLGVSVKVSADREVRPGVRHAAARLARGTSSGDYNLLHGSAVRMVDVSRAEDDDQTLMVFTTFVAPRTADAFRRAGVQYVDVAGNAWVAFGDVLIDVRGRPRPRDVGAPLPAGGNLFSAGRAQVVFALLAWPQLWDAPQRELAHAAGVSLGQVNNSLAMLREAGYGSDRAGPPQAELLDLWAAAFPIGLARRLALAEYHGEIEQVRGAGADDLLYVSGESAVIDLLRPATLTLYVERFDPRLAIKNRWRTDVRANVFVRRKFWNSPEGSEGSIASNPTAPWPLVYADLVASEDARVRSAAREWRSRSVGHGTYT